MKEHPRTGDEKQEGPSIPSKSSVDSSKRNDEDASSKIDGDEQLENSDSDNINTDGDVPFDGSSDPCESNEESMNKKMTSVFGRMNQLQVVRSLRLGRE